MFCFFHTFGWYSTYICYNSFAKAKKSKIGLPYTVNFLYFLLLFCFLFYCTCPQKCTSCLKQGIFDRPGSVSPITLNDVKNAEKLLLQESRRQVSSSHIFILFRFIRTTLSSVGQFFFQGIFKLPWLAASFSRTYHSEFLADFNS
jgi:hypothetical protein